MTKDCLNKYIQDIQCKYSKLAKDTSDAFNIDRGDLKCNLNKLRVVSFYIESMYYYVPFDADVTYAHRFKITRTDSQQITIEIDIGGVVFSHTGSGDALSFAENLANQVNNNTQTPDYDAKFFDNILYIFSYDSGSNFSINTVVNVIQGSDQDNKVTKENYEDKLSELLNTWNCLTEGELCQIIDHSYDLLPESC